MESKKLGRGSAGQGNGVKSSRPKKAVPKKKAAKKEKSEWKIIDPLVPKQLDEEKIQGIAENVVKGLDEEIEALGKNLALYVIEAIDKVEEERKTDSTESLDTWQVVLNVMNRDGLYVMQEVKASKYIATGSYIEFIQQGNVVALFNSCMFLYATKVKPSVDDCTCGEDESVCDCTKENKDGYACSECGKLVGKDDAECECGAKFNLEVEKEKKAFDDLLEYRGYVAMQCMNDKAHEKHWLNELTQTDKLIRKYKGIDTYDCGCGYEYGKTK